MKNFTLSPLTYFSLLFLIFQTNIWSIPISNHESKISIPQLQSEPECPFNGSVGTPAEDYLEVCKNTEFTLMIYNISHGPEGYEERNWQFSPAGEEDWIDIEDSEFQYYTAEDGIQESTDFRYRTICINTNEAFYTEVIQVEVLSNIECYCIPENINCNFDQINNVKLSGETVTLNNDSECSENGYGDYTDLTSPDLFPSNTYTLSVYAESDIPNYLDVKAWIDFNEDGEFSEDELIGNTYEDDFENGTVEFTFNIPESADVGTYRMRIKTAFGDFESCSQSFHGEVEDYMIEILPFSQCSDDLNPQIAYNHSLHVLENEPFLLEVSQNENYSAGINRTWQTSLEGQNHWEDIEDAQAHKIAFSVEEGIETAMDFRYTISCMYSNESVSSNIIEVKVETETDFCVPENANGCANSYISNITLEGDNITLNNDSECSADGFGDYTSLTPPDLTPGETYTLQASVSNGFQNFITWIDFNQDGEFSYDEQIIQTSSGYFSNYEFIIPETAKAGYARMRVRMLDNVPYFSACSPSSQGEIEDYFIYIQPNGSNTLPSDWKIDGITENSADVSWTLPTESLQWEIMYGEEDSFDLESFDNATVFTTSNSSNTLSDLESETNYKIYIRASLTDIEEPDWIGPFVFKTLLPNGYCDPTTDVSLCNTGSNKVTKITIEGENNTGISDTNNDCSEDIFITDYTTDHIQVVPDSTYTLKLNVENSFAEYALWVDFNQNGAFEESELIEADANSPINQGAVSIEINIPEETEPMETRMRLMVARSNLNGSSETVIDPCNETENPLNWAQAYDFMIKVLPDSCPWPSQVSADNLTNNTVEISWDADELNDSWDIEYGEKDFNLGSGNLISDITSSPYILENLEENTEYDFYLKPICEGEEYEGHWGGPISFQTVCEFEETPYLQDFEDTTLPDPHSCERLESTIDSGWQTYSLPEEEGSNSVLYWDTGWLYNEAETWFITKGIYLNSEEEYQISFKYGNVGAFATNDLKVAYGTNPVVNKMTETLAQVSYPNSDYDIERVIFNVEESGVYYFGFNSSIEVGESSFYLDDILVEVAPTCFPPTDISVDYYDATQAEISWSAAQDETEWEIIYGINEAGIDIKEDGELVENITDTFYNLQGLEPNSDYKVYMRSSCGDDKSIWEEPVSFHTYCASLDIPIIAFEDSQNSDYQDCGFYQSSSNLNWKILPAETSEQELGFEGNVLKYSGSNGDQAWYFTQGINLEAETSYVISFKYGSMSSGDNQYLQVDYGMIPDSLEMNTTLVDVTFYNDYYESKTELEEVIFTVEESGVYHFGFKSYSDYYPKISVDNLIIDEVGNYCLTPTDIVASAVGINQAEISWTAGYEEEEWEIKYGSEDFDPDNEGIEITGIIETDYTLEDLDDATHYDLYVRAICAETDSPSLWSQKINFTTQCGVEEIPYYEDFEELNIPELPYCSSWETDAEGDFDHFGWGTRSNVNGFLGNILQHSDQNGNLGNTDEAWYFTPGIALEEGMEYKIKFDYAVKTSYPYEPARDLKVTIGNAADIESATTTLLVLEQTGQTNPEEAYAYLAIEETGVYNFGFQTSSTYYGNTLYIDNISIETAADLEEDCPQPTNLNIDETTDTSAEISWTIEGEEEEWAVQYGEEGFDFEEEEGTLITLSTNSYTFEYPEFNKTYELYVRALCEERESYWVGPLSITADCIIQSIPFTEDFENIEPPAISNCSTTEVISGNEWETELIYGHGFFSNILKYRYLSDEPGDSWFFTEPIYLEADKFYTLSFKYGINEGHYSEKMKVAYGEAAESEAMLNEIVDLENIINGYAETGEFIFKPNENGVYYLGFQAYSPEDQYEIYLDDINLEEAPDCQPVSNINVSNINTDSATVNWDFTETETQSNWEIRYGESGFGVETGGTTISSTEPEKLLTNLNENTVYDVYVRTVCGQGERSAWRGAVSFSTACGFTDIPFVQNFEEVDTPELPFCSTIETNSGWDWETWPPNKLVHQSHPSEEADAWYFTQGINLEANTTYSMKFILETGSSAFTQSLKVARGTSPQSAAMNDVLFDFDGEVFADPEEVSTEFTVPEDGVFYFGFQDYSAADQFLFFISNIRIGLVDTCFPPSDISFSNQTEASVDVSWNSNNPENNWEILYGESGTFTPENLGNINSQNISNTSTTLTDLIDDSAYDFYIRTVCSETNQSAWEGPFQFDTYEEIYCHPEYSIGCEGLTGSSIKDVVLHGENYTQIYDLDTGCGENGYDDRTEFSVDLYQSNTYNLEVIISGNSSYFAIWIDFNDNGEFEESERVAAVYRESNTTSAGFSIPIDIPDLSDQYGDHRMRILSAWSIFINDAEVLDPCNLGEYEQESGEIHDYTVSIVPEILCALPENINLEPVSYNAVEVSWDWEENSEWEIVYDITGFDPNVTTDILSTNQNSMVLDDLEINTDFDIYVRSVCDENYKSGWSGPYLFSSFDFGPPENVNVNHVDGNTVAVSWDIGDIDNTLLNPSDSDVQPGWEVKYDLSGFNPDLEGTSEMTYTNAITLYDLIPDTNYDIYVRSVWDSETKSEWISSAFLTRCEATDNLDLSFQDISPESVNIHWDEEIENNGNLEFIYGLEDFNTEEEGTIINPDSMPYLLTGLEENTAYDIYIRTLCSDQNHSLWWGPYNFETTLLSVDSKEFENFTFYPNPVESHLILKAGIPIEKVVLYNLLGQKVLETQPQEIISVLDLEKLQNGLYMLKVEINGYSKTLKLIKK